MTAPLEPPPLTSTEKEERLQAERDELRAKLQVEQERHSCIMAWLEKVETECYETREEAESWRVRLKKAEAERAGALEAVRQCMGSEDFFARLKHAESRLAAAMKVVEAARNLDGWLGSDDENSVAEATDSLSEALDAFDALEKGERRDHTA